MDHHAKYFGQMSFQSKIIWTHVQTHNWLTDPKATAPKSMTGEGMKPRKHIKQIKWRSSLN